MRNVETVTVPAEWGARDAGKVFQITEMHAGAAEKWALRMIIALKGTTAQIPESLAPYGMVAIFIRGMNSFLAAPDIDFGKIEPLLDEMMVCVKLVRDPKARSVKDGGALATELVSPDDIEEVRTIGWLRSEVLRVHTGFSFVESFLSWLSTMNKSMDSPTT